VVQFAWATTALETIGRPSMSYAQLEKLLDPEQVSQLEVVRRHLLANPTLLDKVAPSPNQETEESSDG